MNKYFSGDIDGPLFAMYSYTHIAALAVLILVNAFLIFWFRKFNTKKSVHSFRYWLAGILLLNEAAYILWSVYSGIWSLDYSLPLHLCSAATFVSIAMLVLNNYPCFEILYFWGLGGSLQALLTPDLAYPYPHFVFFNFFLGHGAILTSIFYMTAVEKFRPTLKSIVKTMIITNLYMAAVAVVNVLTGGNYMFLSHKPENPSIIDFLGPWPWYILSLEAVGLVICLLCYIPFGVGNFMRRKNQSKGLSF